MHKKPLIVFAVLLLSAITSFWMLPAKTLDSHECFVSVTSREMLQNHDYVWPTFNGISRIQKTPLSYWIAAGFAKLTGNVDEISTRLPSALFSFFSAIAIFYFLNKWLSFSIAAFSTAVWTTSFAYIRCSHNARPDTAMTFFVVLCLLCFYSVITAENRRSQILYSLIFWVSFALGNLAKGPAPIPYVFIPVGIYIIFTQKWNIIGKMLPLIGSFIFLVIVCPWFLFIAHRLNWDLTLWKHEYFDRLFGDYAPGAYPFYFYFPDMIKYICPWFVFVPIALFTPFYKIWQEKRPVLTYLWIWFIADFIFLTIDAGKRQHYILPLIPPMAIIIGIILDDMFFSKKAYDGKFIKNIVIVHATMLALAALASPLVIGFLYPAQLWKVLELSFVILVFSIVTLLLLAKHRSGWAAASIFSGIAIFILICFYNFAAVTDTNADSRDFAKKIAANVPASGNLVCYDHVTSIFLQYYGHVVPEITDISKLSEYYNQGYWIVCFSDNLPKLKNENFTIIYSQEKKEGHKVKTDTAGTLFHKSTSINK